ncbi:hypothetical protein Ancab_017005 [Ancistrocladus abbreviatus]
MGEPQLGSAIGEDKVDGQNKEEKGEGENGPNQRIGIASVLGCRIKNRRVRRMSPLLDKNYVVQFILELKVDHVTRVVMSQLKGCFVRFSIKKYASNVIQKCLNASDDGQVNLIISKVTSKSSHFRTILQDPFGNYVA